MAQRVLDALAEHEVTGSVVRIVDHGVKPVLSWIWGSDDAWPGISSSPIHPAALSSGRVERLGRVDRRILETRRRHRHIGLFTIEGVVVVGVSVAG